MEVTLYKNVILNSNYDEVFRHKSLVDTYLSNIETSKKFSLTIDDTYINLKGSIVVYFATKAINTFDYNYMTVENTTTNEKYYCFIRSIDVGNMATRINYITDVWTTFCGKWSLRDSYVTNTRFTRPDEPRELPLSYISNSIPLIHNDPNNTGVSIIVELQTYKLASAGEVNFRNNKTFVIEHFNGTNFSYSIDDIPYFIDHLTYNQSFKTLFQYYNGSIIDSDLYYNIVNLYTIPTKWLTTVSGTHIYQSGWEYAFTDGTSQASNPYTRFHEINEMYDELEIYTLPKSPYIKSFGFYTLQIPYIYNGLIKEIGIIINCDRQEFHIYMSYENGYDEITELFTCYLNFYTVDASILQQQKIAQKINTTQGIFKIVNGTVGIASGGANLYRSNQASMAVKQGATLQGMSKSETRQYVYETAESGGKGVIGGVENIVSGIQQIEIANMDKYLNSTFVNNISYGYINAYFDLCYKILDETRIVNANEVRKAIKECGYKVDYFTNDLELDIPLTNLWDFNTIKFGFVRVNGCTTEINEIIKSILMSGTKIWYNSTATET